MRRTHAEMLRMLATQEVEETPIHLRTTEEPQ